MTPRVEEYIGIPYGSGAPPMDCYELVRRFYAEQFRIVLPSVVELCNESESAWMPVEPPGFGDVIAIRCEPIPQHVGIYVGRFRMLHVTEGHMSRIEPIDTLLWRRRIAGYFRHKSLMQ